MGYNMPQPDKKGVDVRMLQKLSRGGKTMGKALKIDGWLAGVHENRVHVLVKSEKNPGQLTLHVFEM